MVVFKYFIYIIFIATSLVAAEAQYYYYDNEKFLIAIPMFNCEGDVICKNTGYFGLAKNNHKFLSILMKPEIIINTVNGHLRGYKFKNGNFSYIIYGDIQSDSNIKLIVEKNKNKILISDELKSITKSEFIEKLRNMDLKLLREFNKFYEFLQHKYDN